MAINLAVAISTGTSQAGGCRPYGGDQHVHNHHHSHCDDEGGGAKPPERNKFLDFLTAPLQALGKGGNNNDREYDKYAAANQGCNMLKG